MNESREMYLETILVLTNRINNVKAIDIVHEMNFSKPTVSVAMKKLKSENYISIDDHGYIHLEKKGLDIANSIYERHQVLSNVLVSLGVDENVASEDACKIEHVISEETFNKIKEHIKKNATH